MHLVLKIEGGLGLCYVSWEWKEIDIISRQKT